MILTKSEILKEIKNKRIQITPFNIKNIGPASVDLTLSNEFRTFEGGEEIVVDENTDYRRYSNFFKADKVILEPGDFALGITKEKIKLPENICGWLGGRSRFARLGLLVHVTASFVQPGIDSRQVLEMRNISSNTLVVKAGTKVCQIMLEKTEGKAKYKGKFSRQGL